MDRTDTLPLSPNSAAARDIAFCVHPYTNLKKHLESGPLVITRGEGVRVYDEDGKAYIEGLAGLWCTSLGFTQERLVEAGARAMRQLPFYHGFGGKAAPPTIDLAERLIDLAPVPMSKVFFANSGSEANDTAIKLIWYYNNAIGRPENKKIISRIKAYHGVTIASASLTGLPANHAAFDLPLDQIKHTDCPHHYRFGNPGESEEDFATRLAESLDALIVAEGPETVAAFFAEPVMGAGGVIVPPATYFDKIQPVLKRHDVLLVADEVICGFGRTGNLWGSQTFAIQPDMLTTAKALSSGYLPISALMISEPIWRAMVEQSDRVGMFGHGFTYSGHPVPAAVALETLDIYAERDIVGHVRSIAPAMQEGLRRFADHPLVGEVRGVGLVAGVEIVADKATKAPFDAKMGVAARVMNQAERNGLITRALGDTLAFSPPLVITEGEIEEMLDCFGCALDETLAWVEQEGRA